MRWERIWNINHILKEAGSCSHVANRELYFETWSGSNLPDNGLRGMISRYYLSDLFQGIMTQCQGHTYWDDHRALVTVTIWLDLTPMIQWDGRERIMRLINNYCKKVGTNCWFFLLVCLGQDMPLHICHVWFHNLSGLILSELSSNCIIA